MVLPTMTLSEVYKEVTRDHLQMSRRINPQILLFKSEQKRKKIISETRSISYNSPYKNEWKIILSFKQGQFHQAYYLISSDSKGHMAYTMTRDSAGNIMVVRISTHFFMRYNERLGLNFIHAKDIIRHFFLNNREMSGMESNILENGLRRVEHYYEKGVGMGWQDDNHHVMHLKTFVSREMYNKDQKIALKVIAGDLPFEKRKTKLKRIHFQNAMWAA